MHQVGNLLLLIHVEKTSVHLLSEIFMAFFT